MRPKINSISILTFLLAVLVVGLVFPSLAAAQYYYPLCTVTATTNYPDAGIITPGSGEYSYGSYVVFYETTNPGYSFNGWYLNGIYEGKLSGMPVTMYMDYQIIAVYSHSVNYLTLSSNGPGSTNPGGGTLSYGTGSTVTITESPNTGNTFSGWYLDGAFMGTSNSLIVTMSKDHQASAFFAGSNTASPTPAPTSMPAPTPNPNLIIPNLGFYCTSRTTNSAFNIEIQGNLAYNGSGLVDAGVYLSYSVTNGNTWQDFAYVQTGSYGNFSAYWMPSASGNYLLRAVYFGDNLYSGVTQIVNFALSPSDNQNQNVFSVESNSTVSSLAFSSATDSLSFSVSGSSGTTGYCQISISKALLPDVSQLQVTLDSSTISYASYSNGNTWLITIYYHHSSHNIVMALNSPASIASPTAVPTVTTSPTSTSTSTVSPTLTPSPITTASPTSPTSTTTTTNPTAFILPPEAIYAIAAVAIAAIVAIAVIIIKKQNNRPFPTSNK